MPALTKDQFSKLIDLITTMKELIQKSATIHTPYGMGMPNGHLYASLMAHMSFEFYMNTIQIMKDAHQIREWNNVLIPINRELPEPTIPTL